MAIDGAKFKAVNTRDKNFTRAKVKCLMAQIEESVERYLHQLDSADRQEPSLARETKTDRLQEKVAKLKEASNDNQIGRAEALKRSMVSLINSPSTPHYAHPMFWAPFTVVGEGGFNRCFQLFID